MDSVEEEAAVAGAADAAPVDLSLIPYHALLNENSSGLSESLI